MLTDVQKEIVLQDGNLIVQASAGTGKTHTMVSKIEHELKKNETFKTIAAITFTIKAADEIKNRIKIDTKDMFIGTNNSFVIEEIIKPFCKDVYGNDFNIDITADYSKKFTSFEEGMDFLRKNGVLGTYCDFKKNFIFELALEVLEKSKACKRFLKSKYFKLYIDEYQDCDIYMHDFFMFIANELNIETFVVGDDKQSIYIWRGANPESFRSISLLPNWKKMNLFDNFRSTIQIQNYSNILMEETIKYYKEDFNKDSIFFVYTKTDLWCDKVLTLIDNNKKTAVLRFRNDDSKTSAILLKEKGLDIIYIPATPIDEITNSSAWFYISIAKKIILPRYSFYDFVSEIPSGVSDKVYNKIKRLIIKLDSVKTNKDVFQKTVCEIANVIDVEVLNEDFERLYKTISDEQYYPAFYVDEIQNISITLHSSKGLEFEQVILFASDYNLKYVDNIYNHYVACTRAKVKLIIVCLSDGTYKDKNFCRDLKFIFESRGKKARDVLEIVI